MYVGGTSKREVIASMKMEKAKTLLNTNRGEEECGMNHTEKTIPVWEKYSLNVSEAAEYYGIGEKRLRQIAGENEGADFILEVGSAYPVQKKII